MPGDNQPTADRGPSDAGPADPTQTADTSDVVSAPAPAGGRRRRFRRGARARAAARGGWRKTFDASLNCAIHLVRYGVAAI